MSNGTQIPLELLAPAGNSDIGKAAVDHGADAVYIGASRFGARANAGNSLDDIAGLIDYAHLFNVRVYLALNTLLSDREIPEAVSIITHAHQAGIDGLILQDTGLLEQDLPPVPLIASTQMNNATPEKVRFLEDLGFSRVILARELSLADIRSIRERTTVELESFVHGALCVCYSGQCYMSQATSGRSGNRGVCAQPCRLPYTLADGKGREVVSRKHLLSLKDLNLVSYLKDLADAGITSFKIEGRYKDAAYVKNVTAAYRKALDRLIETHPSYRRQSSGTVRLHFEPDLARTFNRGYTSYFLLEPEGAEHQAAMDSPKSVGAMVGNISRMENNGFRVKGETLHNGDGLCFVSTSGELQGFRVEKVDNGLVIPSDMKGLSVGLVLFRNHDHDFLKQLDKASARRTLAVNLVFSQTADAVHLSAVDEDGFEASVSLPANFEPARQPDKVHDQIKAQLTSTGNTVFTVTSIDLATDAPGFLPLSLLNSLRRSVLAELEAARRKGYVPRKRMEPSGPPPVYPKKNLDYRANVFNRFARSFYEKHGATVLEEAMETGLPPEGRVLMTTRYCIRRELGACLKNPEQRAKLQGPLTLSDGKRRFELRFDCHVCRMQVLLDRK